MKKERLHSSLAVAHDYYGLDIEWRIFFNCRSCQGMIIKDPILEFQTRFRPGVGVKCGLNVICGKNTAVS